MYKKYSLRLIVFIGCLIGTIVLCSGNLVAAEQIRVKIVSTSDHEMTLLSPISGNWEFSISDFTVTFRLEVIKLIEQTSDAKFKITLRSGDILETSGKKEGGISGEDEWGEEIQLNLCAK